MKRFLPLPENGGAPGPAELGVVLAVCLLGALGLLLRPAPASHTPLGAFATDLTGRTPHQRFNARRAAAALDGVVVPPGRVFSFNRLVRGWTADRGFLKAPVSYDGVLVDDYGGGVCQTSTTVYNAALLAGLPILERHPHTFAPGYAPPGRDAAVAYSGIDLRFRNPYPWPLTLYVRPEGGRLVCRILGAGDPDVHVSLRARILDRFAPAAVRVRPGTGFRRSRWRLRGRDGVRVVLCRTLSGPGAGLRRETVSDDTYLPVARVAWADGR